MAYCHRYSRAHCRISWIASFPRFPRPPSFCSLSASNTASFHTKARVSSCFQALSVFLTATSFHSLISLSSPQLSLETKCISIRGSLPDSWPSFRRCSSRAKLPRALSEAECISANPCFCARQNDRVFTSISDRTSGQYQCKLLCHDRGRRFTHN